METIIKVTVQWSHIIWLLLVHLDLVTLANRYIQVYDMAPRQVLHVSIATVVI